MEALKTHPWTNDGLNTDKIERNTGEQATEPELQVMRCTSLSQSFVTVLYMYTERVATSDTCDAANVALGGCGYR